MTFATVLAVMLAIIGVGAWYVLRARRMALGNWIGLVGLAVWFAVLGTLRLVAPEDPRSDAIRTMAASDWLETKPALASAATPTGVQAAPVESLITGLEARLAEHPDDPNGWALLAQSYAYTANEEAVETAVGRAVALGVDEQSLRERVQTAKRSAHPVDWVERNLRAPAR